MISHWDLVCENDRLPDVARMIFFSGFGLGTFVAGLVSDKWGRKRAMLFFSVVTLVGGISTSFMPVFPAFVLSWWLVSRLSYKVKFKNGYTFSLTEIC